MSVPIDCPHCGNTVVISEHRYATAKGKKAQCKKCGRAFVVDRKLPTAISYAPVQTNQTAYATSIPEKRSNGLGLAATILGLFAIITAFIPLCGIFGAATFGLLGGILGIVGLFSAISDKRTSVAFPIAGVSLCIFAGVLSIFWSVLWTSVASQRIVTAANNVTTRQVIQNAPQARQPEPQIPFIKRGDQIAQFDNVYVKLTDYGVGKVPLRQMSDDGASKDDLLWVTISIVNKSATKKIQYQTWRGADISFERDYASASDNFDNVLKRIDFGFATEIKGAVKNSESIYPSQTVSDVLVFEKPVNGTKSVTVKMPRKNVDETGKDVVFNLLIH